MTRGRRWALGTPLTVTHPELAKQWHPTKNGDLLPSDVSFGTVKKVWWYAHGHEWMASPNTRSNKGRGCAVCSGHQVMVGVNDLASQRPAVAKQWHPTKNGDLLPSDVTCGSKKKVWWYAHGHEWLASVEVRAGTQQQGCAICAGTQVMIGVNDLASQCPKEAAKWHPVKNGDLTPEDVPFSSNKKVWWLDHGHEWQALISNRTRSASTPTKFEGCAVCAGQQVMLGVNDLRTVRPDLAKQWHPTLNGTLRPEDVTFGSGKRIYWNCGRHVWLAKVNDRTASHSGCPKCAKEAGHGTSLAEVTLRNELATRYPGTASAGLILPRTTGEKRGWDCDIIIEMPDGRIVVVEYDGHWHETKTVFDKRKSADLREQGHLVIRVRAAKGLKALHPHDIELPRRLQHHAKASEVADLVELRLTALGYAPSAAQLATSA